VECYRILHVDLWRLSIRCWVDPTGSRYSVASIIAWLSSGGFGAGSRTISSSCSWFRWEYRRVSSRGWCLLGGNVFWWTVITLPIWVVHISGEKRLLIEGDEVGGFWVGVEVTVASFQNISIAWPEWNNWVTSMFKAASKQKVFDAPIRGF